MVEYLDSGKKRVVVKEGTVNITDEVFINSKVEDIKLPESLKMIGNKAFLSCKNLKKIDVPFGTEKVGNMAFCGCTSLEYVHLPNSIKEMGVYVFQDCTSVKDFDVPEYLKSSTIYTGGADIIYLE